MVIYIIIEGDMWSWRANYEGVSTEGSGAIKGLGVEVDDWGIV